jgi:hypothetical protein
MDNGKVDSSFIVTNELPSHIFTSLNKSLPFSTMLV